MPAALCYHAVLSVPSHGFIVPCFCCIIHFTPEGAKAFGAFARDPRHSTCGVCPALLSNYVLLSSHLCTAFLLVPCCLAAHSAIVVEQLYNFGCLLNKRFVEHATMPCLWLETRTKEKEGLERCFQIGVVL